MSTLKEGKLHQRKRLNLGSLIIAGLITVSDILPAHRPFLFSLQKLPDIWLYEGLQRQETPFTHTHTHTYLAYGRLRVTGGRVPAALALNTAAHAGSSGHSGRRSRCQGTTTEAVKTCRTLLHTQRK